MKVPIPVSSELDALVFPFTNIIYKTKGIEIHNICRRSTTKKQIDPNFLRILKLEINEINRETRATSYFPGKDLFILLY